MSNKRPPLIVANWKMNGSLIEGVQFLKELRVKLEDSLIGCDIAICPPFTLLRDFADKVSNTGIKLGAQNCHHAKNGAYTGDISAKMLKDMTCDFVILGHSERRINYNEGSEAVSKKALACHELNMKTIICIGETLYERDNELTKVILREQILHSLPKSANSKNTVIAYEPVWAIGSGKTPSANDIENIHEYIDEIITTELSQFAGQSPQIIYGGSADDNNAKSLLETNRVEGLLVGKASLNIDKFWNIILSVS